MPRIWFAAVPLLALVLPAVAAEPGAWGPAVHGVRMGIAIDGRSTTIRITVQNVEDKPLLLPLGSLIGSRFYLFHFRPILTMPDGRHPRVIDASGPGAVAGRMDPLVVPLAPNASYSVQFPLARFYDLDDSKKLDVFVSQRCQVRVELDLQKITCPLYGYPNPNMIECWQNKVVSNTVQLPI